MTALLMARWRSAWLWCGKLRKMHGLLSRESMLNEDYKEMLQCLLEENVSFLLKGAFALAVHGHPRATKDMDIWIWANPQNAPRVMKALGKFGAPIHQISVEDFSKEGVVYQIGNEPRRMDITTEIDGISFEEAVKNKLVIEIQGLPVPVISLNDLIRNKESSGRPQDLVDVKRLSARKKK